MSREGEISIENYRYQLPDEAIAKHPLERREDSRLLVFRDGEITHCGFKELSDQLPGDSWLVFNNTRVIQARLKFKKPTGAVIEIFCLDPVHPVEHQRSFESMHTCTWKCLVGNAKKWKSGPLSMTTIIEEKEVRVEARRLETEGKGEVIQFQWEASGCSFAEIIDAAGSTPIPPYLKRDAEQSDKQRYQTVYSRDLGSVAAPTAGLHFTEEILQELAERGIMSQEITLHVGAGTFVPVKNENAREHSMHAELVMVSRVFLENWLVQPKLPIAVGTTSTRSMESLYWLGVKLISGQELHPDEIHFSQWDHESLPGHITLKESLEALTAYCRENKLDQLRFTTSLMIVPGYRFRSIRGLITNFHQPGSTLLLLIAALIGEDWRAVYSSALDNNYRFLSYGDSSLLLPALPD